LWPFGRRESVAQSESQLCKLRHKSIFTRQHLLCADVPLPPGQRNGRRLLHFRMPQITRRIFFLRGGKNEEPDRAAGRFSAPRGETLLLLPPRQSQTYTRARGLRDRGGSAVGARYIVRGTRWQESSKRQSKDEGWTGRRPRDPGEPVSVT
jgi:hypothetical protein